MPCYHPIPAIALWQPGYPGHPGKITMKLRPAEEPTHWLPCGFCLGCREIQAQQLAIRIQHEARYHSSNTFLTLTYDDDHLPNGLQKRDLQLFWKRLRKTTQQKLKYLACGEYGDRTQRPHYHAAALGLNLTHRHKYNNDSDTDEQLTAAWNNGTALASELTPDRMRYVAGYVMKKAGYRRQLYCDEHGQELQTPFRTMSQGLGKKWVQQYATDLKQGQLKHETANYTIPRYYTDYLKQHNPNLHSTIQHEKDKNRQNQKQPDSTRLKAAERIRELTIKQRRRERI